MRKGSRVRLSDLRIKPIVRAVIRSIITRRQEAMLKESA